MSSGTDPVHLRERSDGATELRVGGLFVMDDVETSSERLLAQHVLDAGARDVLVGGLGLGFTAAELLQGEVERVVVAELHAEVVEAVRAGAGAGPLADGRLEVVLGDVREVVAEQPAQSLDAVVLDVDNGPDSLVHRSNAAVYEADFVAACTRVLRPGGSLLVWSMADSAALRETLAAHLQDVDATAVPVRLQGRDEHYWLLGGTRPLRG